MNELARYHESLGARLAPDRIPLDYGDPAAEYRAALSGTILLDRSHEGRILLRGRDRFELVNRMSTNDVAALTQRQGRPTVFTNSNARILFRASCYSLAAGLLLVSEAGQGEALATYLRRNIFFGDDARVDDISAATAHFALHGMGASAAVGDLVPNSGAIAPLACDEVESEFGQLIIARRKSICGDHWILIVPQASAVALHSRLLQCGSRARLLPAGSLTYNCLRIRSGRPAGPELTSAYIPLELGLWDEISFSKGCYTGQEIIARLESRGRLAKILVKLALSSMSPAPAPVFAGDKEVGLLTSSVQSAAGHIFALAVVRLANARPGNILAIGPQRLEARLVDYAGAPPPYVLREQAGA
ncbi:MAG: hypothetical protein OXG85_13090 [Chloroflexi bacterium]|nr:hypothetical protein [Chloroflexota bacterium]